MDKNFNLSCEIVFGKPLNSSHLIEVILPVANYNLNQVNCFSSGSNLNCQKLLREDSSLAITFIPSCSQCNEGTSILFSIVNLKNPSFISPHNQDIIVNTRNVEGII